MEKEKRSNLIFFSALIILLAGIFGSFIQHFFNIKDYNAQWRDAYEGVAGECKVSLYPRGGLADSWDKRDIPFNGQIVTFTGTTYDCSIENYSSSVLSDWWLRVNILDDCYINNSWCGTVEIHQHSPEDGSLQVQELDLRSYDKAAITLRHFYIAEDLCIPLSKGDWIIYRPSEILGEKPVAPLSEKPGRTIIGFIFYHLKGNTPHFFCSMGYQLTRGLFQDLKPKLLLAALIVWMILLIVRITFILTFSNIKKESNSVIRAISGIYANLYKINLEDDTFQEIRASERLHRFFADQTSARQALLGAVPAFYCEESRKAAADFYDTSTWTRRLQDSDINSAILKSNDLAGPESGRWYQSNLIVYKRNSRGEPAAVICGILDVDDEVREKEEAKLMTERFATDLAREVAEQTLHIQEIQKRIVSSLGDMIGSRDGNTGGHVKRTSYVIQLLVGEIIRRNKEEGGLEKFRCITEKAGADIARAAPMHDLGKIFIDTSILCKPGKLTEEEYAIMKTHAAHSGDIVNLILRDVEEESFVNIAYNMARYHHERWDGKGYPEGAAGGKIGEGIPIEARIMAVADVYDALVSKRCYKEPMTFQQAFAIMLEGMGSQFDPDMKDIFITCRKELEGYYSENNS